jgi:hypothetical protein
MLRKTIGLGLIATATAFASPASAAAISHKDFIDRVAIDDHGDRAWVWAQGAAGWGSNDCAGAGPLFLDVSTDVGREVYKTALAAFLAGRKVQVSYQENVCVSGYKKVTRIDVVSR